MIVTAARGVPVDQRTPAQQRSMDAWGTTLADGSSSLKPFGSLDPGSVTNQRRMAKGLPAKTSGVGPGMSRGAPTTVNAPSATMAPAVQPEMTVLSKAGPMDSQDFMGGSKTNPGSYDSYINQHFDHAMRTLDPMIQKNEDRFDQSMIDRGFAPGSEGYRDEFDNNSRRYNDLAAAAAFGAMGFGADRMDADRGYGLNRDIFDLNELSTIDGINRAWDEIGFRNAGFNANREDQRFNQMLSMFGLVPSGGVTGFDVGGAAANNANAQLNATLLGNRALGDAANAAGDLIGGVDWGEIFGRFGGGK